MTTNDAVSARLEITVNRIYDVVILSVRGEIDLGTAPQLNVYIDAVLVESAPSALIIDLTDVPFLASVGMTVLVKASEHVGKSARFAVVADGPATSRPLIVMGLDQVITLYTDLDAAVTALAS